MKSINRESGYSLLEITIGIALFILLVVGVLNATTGFFGANDKNLATSQGQRLIQAARVYRSTQGSYASISVTVLSNAGYEVSPFTNGTGQNAYGLNAALASANSDTDATLTYQTSDAAACAQFIQRMALADGVKATSCTTSVATVTIE